MGVEGTEEESYLLQFLAKYSRKNYKRSEVIAVYSFLFFFLLDFYMPLCFWFSLLICDATPCPSTLFILV